MSSKTYLIIWIISFLSFSCALTNKTTLHFNNGEKKTGVGKLANKDQIKFKTAESKSQKFHFKNLKRVELQNDEEIETYVYLKVKEKDYSMVVEELIVGRINLYRRVNEGSTMAAPIGGFGNGAPMMNTEHYYRISNYYVKKENETELTHLGSTSLFSKNFKKAAAIYFNDCSVLVNKIEQKEFKKRDIEKIVTFYNTNC